MKRTRLSNAAHRAYLQPAVAQIRALTEHFVTDVVAIATDACRDALLADLAGRPGRSEHRTATGPRPIGQRDTPPAMTNGSAPDDGGPEDERQEALRRLVLQHVHQHPGCHMEDLRAQLGLTRRQVLAPLRDLLEARLVHAQGRGRLKSYAASQAVPTRPSASPPAPDEDAGPELRLELKAPGPC